ncbi:MAG: phosphatase PAP2 family protein [Anaerolineaceae bacterium]
MPWRDVEPIEGAVFFGHPPGDLLQRHLYARNLVWLDFAGFLLHASWFFLPFAVGGLITIFERRRLLEFLAWLAVAAYISDIGYLFFPVRPPWMEPDFVRVLVVRAFVNYTGVDDNPVAAFPSLHAAIPLAMALFLWLRCARLRPLAWPVFAFCAAISFAVVYLGEHWFLDVAAGWALAALVAYLFTSPQVKRLAARIPGDPIGRLVRFDARFSSFDEPDADEAPSAKPLPRAA